MTADGAHTFELRVTGAPHRFTVISFTGREQISRSYAFDVRLAGPLVDVDAIAQLYVGRPAHLRFGGEGDADRWVHGVVARMGALGLDGDGDNRHGYTLRLVPALRLLGHRKNSRIFQEQSVPEIVRTVLRASGVSLLARLSRSYRPRVYCVQHQETDLRFVERLLREEGIFYFFDQPPGEEASEIMVLADDASACKPVAGNAAMRVRGVDGMRGGDDRDLRSFRIRRRVEPGSVVLEDFDFQRPSFDLKGQAPTPGPKAAAGKVEDALPAAQDVVEKPTGSLEPDAIEQYHHHGELEPGGVDDGAARTRLEQHRRKLWVGVGESHAPRLSPGHTITVQEAVFEARPGSYTLFEVEHEGHNPRALRAAPAQPHTYLNRFRCVPASAPFRPRPPRPRIQQVLETATVVGPAGEEIHTDASGRIKVQFHWDREGQQNEHSSCWIRVMQPWAGAGWGFQFIPRVGMEVVVAFLAGDVDRPMVMGSVYNQEHPPVFRLPAGRTRSGIRTQSSPGGQGYNEISFEDQRGSEQVVIRAEKHLVETVGVDHTTHVGHSSSLSVSGDQSATVGGDASLSVAGDRRDHVTGDRSENTSGSSSVGVIGNRSETVGGHRSIEVGGASTAQVHGSASAQVDQHASLTALGGLSVDVGAAEASSGTLHAKGSWFIGADQDVVVHAARSLSLQCGDSVIRVTPDQIELTSKAILMTAKDQIVLRADQAALELAGEASIAAPATRLFGKSASMELTTSAFMKGTQVKLGERDGDPPKFKDPSQKVETRTLKLKLTDAGFVAYKSRPFELTVEGVRYTGTTGGDGSVSQEIPKDATQAHLLLWEGDPPAGKSRVWNLVIGEPAAASTLEGARSRLANLGYPVGTGEGLDAITRQALVDFQEDHDVEPTGALDGATASKLAEIHGH